jgi:hypothetical protein
LVVLHGEEERHHELLLRMRLDHLRKQTRPGDGPVRWPLQPITSPP